MKPRTTLPFLGASRATPMMLLFAGAGSCLAGVPPHPAMSVSAARTASRLTPSRFLNDAAADGQAGHVSGQGRVAARVGLEHRHVAGMMIGRIRGTMRLARGIEVAARTRRVRRAAIAFLVNVESVTARGKS